MCYKYGISTIMFILILITKKNTFLNKKKHVHAFSFTSLIAKQLSDKYALFTHKQQDT